MAELQNRFAQQRRRALNRRRHPTSVEFDWRDEIRRALATLRAADGDVDAQVDACQVLIEYGITGVLDPDLARLEAISPRARQLRVLARQLERSGLVTGLPSADSAADGDRHEFNSMPGFIDRSVPGARTLVLMFAGMSQHAFVSFELIQRLLHPAGVGVLYLRDLHRNLYTTGIPGLGGDFAATAEALQTRIAAARPARVLAIGNSAGCAGALRYGLALGVHAVLCIGPRFNRRADHGKEGASLGDAYRKASGCPPVTLIYGDHCETDMVDVHDFDGVPGTRRLPIAGFDQHDCIRVLLIADVFRALLRGFVEHGAVPAELDVPIHGAYQRLNQLTAEAARAQ